MLQENCSLMWERAIKAAKWNHYWSALLIVSLNVTAFRVDLIRLIIYYIQMSFYMEGYWVKQTCAKWTSSDFEKKYTRNSKVLRITLILKKVEKNRTTDQLIRCSLTSMSTVTCFRNFCTVNILLFHLEWIRMIQKVSLFRTVLYESHVPHTFSYLHM